MHGRDKAQKKSFKLRVHLNVVHDRVGSFNRRLHIMSGARKAETTHHNEFGYLVLLASGVPAKSDGPRASVCERQRVPIARVYEYFGSTNTSALGEHFPLITFVSAALRCVCVRLFVLMQGASLRVSAVADFLKSEKLT